MFKLNLQKGFAHILLIAGLVLLVIGGVFLLQTPFFKQIAFSPKYLAVVSAIPTGVVSDNYQKITIEFNLPVTAHHIEGYYSISPTTKGRIVQGTSPNTIVFEPQDPYPDGSRIRFMLKRGLLSDSGKKLDHDYILEFSTDRNTKTVDFSSSGISSKFLSFSKDKGTDIDLLIGESIQKPSIKIYKATVEDLLNSLSYASDEYSYGSVRSGKYYTKEIDLTKLKLIKEYLDVEDNTKINFKDNVGLYLITAVKDNKVINSAWFTLNSIGIHLRQDDQNVYLAAQDIITGAPQSGIDITFYQLLETPKQVGKHTLGNIQEYPFTYPNYLDLVIGTLGEEVIVIPVSIPNSQAELNVRDNLNEKHEIFIYTDRPIYKKKDQVAFRGLVRIDNDGLYKLPKPGTKIRVFGGGTAEKGFDQILELNSDGTFSGEFKIGDKFQEGTNYLYATTDLDENKTYASDIAYFDVTEYIKPDFNLDINVDKGEYTRGDNITVYLEGNYFNGNVLSAEKVTYNVYRKDYYETEKAVYNSSFNLNSWGGMCGGGFGFGDEYFGEKVGESKDVTLDKNGKATMDFNTKDIGGGISQEITFVIERLDKNNNKIVSAKNAIVHNGEFNIFIRPTSNGVKSGEEFTTIFYVESLTGQNLSNKNFTYNFYEEKYDSNYRKQNKTILKSGNVTTNNEGVGMIKDSLRADSSKSFYLEVTSVDGRNNNIETRKYISIYPEDAKSNKYNRQTILKIISDTNNLTPGQPAKLIIDSPSDMQVFASFERGRVYKPGWLNLKKGQNTFQFTVDDVFIPSITPTFSFFYQGEYYIEGLSLNVPALKKLINVEVSADKQIYTKGDTAVITITTKDASGNLIPTSIGVGIVDKAIFALRKNATQPIHSSFYFFRPRSTNASSSLTWISNNNYGGRGGGGGGGESLNKDVDTLYWNPNLKTGSDGKLTINVPLGATETVWKILVYSSTDDTYLGQAQLDVSVRK